MDILTVDDKPFPTIVAILNDVFGIKKSFHMKGYHDISPNKRAVFFHLAERLKDGGWKAHKTDSQWLNIPDCDEKTFTQIQLNKCDDSFFKSFTSDKVDKKQQAVFMGKKEANGRVLLLGDFYRQAGR